MLFAQNKIPDTKNSIKELNLTEMVKAYFAKKHIYITKSNICIKRSKHESKFQGKDTKYTTIKKLAEKA